MSLACPWCHKPFDFEGSIVRHATRVHKKRRYDYDLLVKHNGVVPKCACGCEQDVAYSQHFFGFNRFIHGHQQRDPDVLAAMLAGSVTADRELLSQRKKEWWTDPTNAEKQQKVKATWTTAMQRGHAVARTTPEYTANISNRMKEQWSSEWGQQHREYCKTQEFRDTVSANTKQAVDNDVIRDKLSRLASQNQANGKIGTNLTKRTWVLNPFTGVVEHFDSGWEVTLLNNAVARGIPIKRNSDVFIPYQDINGRSHRYVPDFVTLSGLTLIEVKGRMTDNDVLKLAAGEAHAQASSLSFVVFPSKSSMNDDALWQQIR